MLSFFGLVLTASAIIWRGGTLTNRLSRIELDVAKLVKFQEDAVVKFIGSAADAARTETEISDLKRRTSVMESRCEECLRWRRDIESKR
jgi:hypothetical protein